MRKITVAVLVMSILISSIMPCLAANDSTSTNEGQILYKTAIFKDLSVDFKDAKGQLKRKEAAIIITRLMSKETTVLQNKTQYTVDKVKDIKTTDIAAPYIGFVINQKLMGLDENGNFAPDKIISEKEFLSMLVKTLKYEEKVNFNYIDTYKFSYNIGIVKNETYKKKSFNNYFYSRKNAISAIYNTLLTKPNGSDNMLISDLIKNKVITREYAETAGLLKDIQATQIVEAKSISNTQVAVSFNEPINKISDKDIIMHGQDDSIGIFTSIASISGKELILNTSGQTQDKKYIVELKNIEDKDGFVTEKVTSDFTGYKNYEILSDLFKISKIEVESKSIINVFFTQPVTSNTENPVSYELFEGTASYIKGSFTTMIPKVKKKYNNCISIYLKEKDLKEGVSYKIKIAGDVQSAYGVKLNDGSGDSAEFIGKTGENKAFDIVSIVPTDSKTIVVEFTRDVDGTSACSASNYTINGNVPATVLKAVVGADGEGKNVTLGLNIPLNKDATYELTINNVYDSYRQTSVNAIKYPFSGWAPERDKIGIVGVTPIDKGSIAVYFDRPIDSNSALMPSSYSITGSGTSPAAISAVSYNYSDPHTVKLFLASDSLVSGMNYTLTVYSTLRDEAGNMFSSNATYSFNGSGTENMKPALYNAKIVGSDTIMVKVSEDICTNGMNGVASNYSVEYKDGSNTKTQTATSVSMYDPSTLLIRFFSLSNSTAYTLKYNSLSDYTGNSVNSGSTSVSSAQ